MPPMPVVGEVLAGYRIRGVLGRGGMSVVYEAEHARLGNVVALKVLTPELADDEVFRTRFLRESRIVASLSHPNVIPIYDSGPSGDLLYIAMRYVSGADLRAVLSEHGQLNPDQALLLIEQAGRALDAAHRAGLIHRDVKPANILIEHGGEGEPDHVSLADFGLSKHALSRSGSLGELAGTVDYIAPEQIKGEQISERTDLYSLACVLYQCLTGQVPFPKDLDAAVIWAQVEEQAARASSINPELPAGIDDVLTRALAKDPAERYATSREFVAAARDALSPALGRSEATAQDQAGTVGTVLTGAVTARPAPIIDRQDDVTAESKPAPGWLEASPPRDDPSWRPGTGAFTPGGDGLRRWLGAAGVLAAVLIVALVVWLITRGHASPSPPTRAAATMHSSTSTTMHSSTTMHATPKPTNPILAALTRADQDSVGARGLLPPSTCTVAAASMVRCSNPHFAVSAATFETFHSLRGLYANYVQRARMLSGGSFQANVNDCTEGKPSGEVSWNHDYEHPRTYSIGQAESGHLSENDAAGRVFCTFANGDYVLLWTQNAGHLLAELAGNPHGDAWLWWKHVHHEIALGSSSMMSQMG